MAAEIVRILWRADSLKEAYGVSLYGGDLNKWPIKLVDAAMAYEDEKGKEYNERMRAFMLEAENK